MQKPMHDIKHEKLEVESNWLRYSKCNIWCRVTSPLNSINHLMAHWSYDTGSARTVDASTEWKEESTLSTSPQVVPKPTCWAQAKTERQLIIDFVNLSKCLTLVHARKFSQKVIYTEFEWRKYQIKYKIYSLT